MKTLLAASALGTLFGAATIPAFQAQNASAPPKPFTLFGTVTAVNQTTGGFTFPRVPRDFILTDVIPGSPGNGAGAVIAYTCRLLADGQPVLELGWNTGGNSQFGPLGWLDDTHLTSGLLIKADTTLSVAALSAPGNGSFSDFGVTLCGFIYEP